MSLQNFISLDPKSEFEQLQIEVEREKERKYGEWAELVLAGKTNLPWCDWLSKMSSEH